MVETAGIEPAANDVVAYLSALQWHLPVFSQHRALTEVLTHTFKLFQRITKISKLLCVFLSNYSVYYALMASDTTELFSLQTRW